MNPLDDLIATLAAAPPPGVPLLRSEALEVVELWVDSQGWAHHRDDPHAGEEGYYVVPGVNLIDHEVGGLPWGALVWVPDAKLFGAWDAERGDLWVFPGVSWPDIAARPQAYARVDVASHADHDAARWYVPWPAHGFESHSG